MASNDYPEQLHRLQTEQNKAINETRAEIDKWKSFKSDYEALKKRLKTLPDELSHDVMVPFGKMAFMPGKIVHTNEILVLLGDNWFVDRSAKQAAQIVDRRIKTVDKSLQDLENQMKLLEPRREFTSELGGLSQEAGDMQDIREEYDEETERQWKEKHRKRVQESKQRMKKKSEGRSHNTGVSDQVEKTAAELWDRLEQLEQIEQERKEIHKLGTTAEHDMNSYKFPAWPDTSECEQYSDSGEYQRNHSGLWTRINSNRPNEDGDNYEEKNVNDIHSSTVESHKGSSIAQGHQHGGSSSAQHHRVNLEGIDTESESGEIETDSETNESDVLDSDDDEDSDGDEVYDDNSDKQAVEGCGDMVHLRPGKRITFSHTSQQNAAGPVNSDKGAVPNNPGDIYPTIYKPKSILRKAPAQPRKKIKHKVRQTKVAFDTASDDSLPPSNDTRQKPVTENVAKTAFSGTVLEKPNPLSAIPAQSTQHQPPITQATPSSGTKASVSASLPSNVPETTRPVSRFKAQRLNKENK